MQGLGQALIAAVAALAGILLGFWLRSSAAGKERRQLEVMVADVVRGDLVVPEEASACAVEREQRIGVGHRPVIGQMRRLVADQAHAVGEEFHVVVLL